MENWKKYEVYFDKIKTGTLNINVSVIKKALSLSMAGIITVTSLTGCSIINNPVVNAPEEIETTLNYEEKEEEISDKTYFVESVLAELSNTEAQFLFDRIKESYIEAKHIETQINSENEYSMFLTEEEITKKKEAIINALNDSIDVIESNTNWKFGIDFINLKTKSR